MYQNCRITVRIIIFKYQTDFVPSLQRGTYTMEYICFLKKKKKRIQTESSTVKSVYVRRISSIRVRIPMHYNSMYSRVRNELSRIQRVNVSLN